MAPRSKSKKDVSEEVEEDVAMTEPPTSHQPTEEEGEDESMNDQEDGGEGVQQNDDEDSSDDDDDDAVKVKLLPGSTPTAASFEFQDEGHTLGNALRWVIMKNPDVEFCAYAIPHPSEDRMNIRIQTYEGTTAIQALEKGLRDLQDLSDVVTEKFIAARDEFTERMTS